MKPIYANDQQWLKVCSCTEEMLTGGGGGGGGGGLTQKDTRGKKILPKIKKDLVMACHIRNYSTSRKS